MSRSLYPGGLAGGLCNKRRIIAEDPDWSLEIVPCLSNLCLQSIVRNFEVNPIYEELPPMQREFVQERLSTSLPLHVTANVISDGVYWKRCCQQRWDLCDVSAYGHSWKCMFFERHIEHIIELFIPDVTELKTLLELVPLCKNYIKRLDISQLLPPIKEEEQELEEEEYSLELASDNDCDGPSMDHFDFSILLNKLPNLVELHLVYRVNQCGMNFEWKMFEMTNRDCESLAKALKSCRTLQLFRLYESHIEDKKCCLLVKHLLDHPSLRELDFSHNQIGDRGARAISKLLTRSKLETLNMCDNNIRGPGGRAIAHALSVNSSLLSLNLRLNHLGDEGGEAVGKALLNNNTLLHLHLGANDVTGPTAIALAQVLAENNTLKSINLSCNNLGTGKHFETLSAPSMLVPVQTQKDGGRALEMAMSHNTSATECDIRLTEVDEQSASIIKKAVRANQIFEIKRQARLLKSAASLY